MEAAIPGDGLARDKLPLSRVRKRGSKQHRTGLDFELGAVDDLALEAVAARAAEYVDAARAPNTKRAYRTDWAEFSAWAKERRLAVMPAAPATLALYLTDLAAVAKTSTVERRLASIAFAHRTAGYPSPTYDPTVKAVWAGIRRVHGTAQDQAAPITVPLLRRMIATLAPGPGGTRDADLLLVGFAGALRRSELVALDVEDLEERHEGVVVTLHRSKTDQEATGRQVGISYGSNPATCTVRNLRRWLDLAAITDGPLFRPVDRHGRVAVARLSGAGANRMFNASCAAPAPIRASIQPILSVPDWPPPPPRLGSPNG